MRAVVGREGVGWTTAPDDLGREHTLSAYVYSVSLGFGVCERFGTFVELFGTIPASASGGPANSLDGGVSYLLRDNLQLDAAAGLGLSDAAGDWFVSLGVSVLFRK